MLQSYDGYVFILQKMKEKQELILEPIKNPGRLFSIDVEILFSLQTLWMLFLYFKYHAKNSIGLRV